jgi:hypothetical protein
MAAFEPGDRVLPCARCETCHHGLPEGSMAARVACIAAQAQMIAGAATDLTVRLAADSPEGG